MTWLFLAIICSSSIALIFKYSENNNMNRYAVTSINYLTAFVVSFIMIIIKNPVKLEELHINISSFQKEFVKVVLQSNGSFAEGTSLMWATVLGLASGLFFFLSFVYYQKSVRDNGAALSGTFGKLGILIPMIFSIIIWKEVPTGLQWLGIGIALFSIILVNISFKKNTISKFNGTLIWLFIFGGMAEFQNKLFQKYALIDFKDVFLFFTFFTAFFFSLYFTIKSKRKIRGADIFTGLLVGIPNLFSSYFLIMALSSVATSIAFPVYSAGSIIFISLGGVAFYKEKLSNKNKGAILLVIFALILINI